MTQAAEWGTGQVFLSMVWFFLFFIWVWLLIDVFADVFRSRDLSGWGKAGWTFFVIVAPFLGVFVYLIARGPKMHAHAVETAQAQDAAFREYVQAAVAGPNGQSSADQLARFAELHAKGVLSDAEFEQAKAKVLA